MSTKPLFEVGDTVYVKCIPAMTVYCGTVYAVEHKVWAIDYKGRVTQHMVTYTLTVSDRRDGGFVHRTAPECNVYKDFDSAWYEQREEV
jgi:hypothetical protein